MKFSLFSFCTAFQSLAFANWNAHTVDGAYCGNGEDYVYYERPGNPEKVVIELRGGGACWNERTCFGSVPLTTLAPQGPDYRSGLSSTLAEESFLSDAHYVSLPYCTGDVYSGSHETRYGNNDVLHVGSNNVELVLGDLKEKFGFFRDAKKLVFYGQSAGAIGVLLHIDTVDSFASAGTEKVALVDAPGLHFGDTFFNKFPSRWFADLQAEMRTVGVFVDGSTGMVATQMDQICENFPAWNIGFMQGTRDLIMSRVFGSISPRDHEEKVLSSEGLSGLAASQPGRCSVWLNRTSHHTFTGKASERSYSTGGVSAFDFSERVTNGESNLFILP